VTAKKTLKFKTVFQSKLNKTTMPAECTS
jgi:hypothetical protein